MAKILEILRTFVPDYWLMNYRYSRSWDKALNRLMDSHFFTNINQYTAKIGDIKVWVENHPYASFTPHQREYPIVRPSRATIVRARKKLIKDGYSKIAHDNFDRLK